MQIVMTGGGDATNHLQLTGGELVMLEQVASEATNGIRINGFSRQIGVSKERARDLLRVLSEAVDSTTHAGSDLPPGHFDLSFSATDARALRNALELVMQDLGQEEFSTRTGFELSEAAQLLNKLNSSLLAALHIVPQPTIYTDRH